MQISFFDNYFGSEIKMKKYYADKNSMNLMRFLLLIVAVLLIGAAYYFLFERFTVIAKIVIVAVASIYAAAALIILPIWYRSVYCCISGETASICTGIFIKNCQLVKIASVQHIILVTTPFSRYTGMNFITLNFLGGFAVIPFLSYSDATEIYSKIQHSVAENH